jgi:hypothetical protein
MLILNFKNLRNSGVLVRSRLNVVNSIMFHYFTLPINHRKPRVIKLVKQHCVHINKELQQGSYVEPAYTKPNSESFNSLVLFTSFRRGARLQWLKWFR